jgi:hypothetical protein
LRPIRLRGFSPKLLGCSVHRHPFAGFAQSPGDFLLRHGRRKLGAQLGGPVRTLDRSDVEPFVGGDDVDLANIMPSSKRISACAVAPMAPKPASNISKRAI